MTEMAELSFTSCNLFGKDLARHVWQDLSVARLHPDMSAEVVVVGALLARYALSHGGQVLKHRLGHNTIYSEPRPRILTVTYSTLHGRFVYTW
jgi:hypothetical protein